MSATPRKYLAIDHGAARIGLAVSDDLGMLAHPLETVPAGDEDRALERIVVLVEERRVATVVLGLPLRIDGREGTATEKVRAFAKKLKAFLPDPVDLVEQDERLTTVSAMEKLHEAGRTTKNTRQIIDQAAAVEILQAYLDRVAGPVDLPDPFADEDEDWDEEGEHD